MQMLRFVRGEHEYRSVSVEEDGTYRIWAQTGSIGKLHEDFNSYFQHLRKNGWKKTDLREFLKTKYRR